jgi:hypothetical protein
MEAGKTHLIVMRRTDATLALQWLKNDIARQRYTQSPQYVHGEVETQQRERRPSTPGCVIVSPPLLSAVSPPQGPIVPSVEECLAPFAHASMSRGPLYGKDVRITVARAERQGSVSLGCDERV